jgi:hypothetical protein
VKATPLTPFLAATFALGLLLLPGVVPTTEPTHGTTWGASVPATTAPPTPLQNYTAAIQRVVTLLGLSGSGLLAIVWARVALSWFSNDVTKKVQAKDRARDALIGTILFTAAVSGLLFGLAQWIVTGA